MPYSSTAVASPMAIASQHAPTSAPGSAPVPISRSAPVPPQIQCNSISSYSSSPRQFPSDLPESILEEGVESGSDSPVEPVTPTSGRHSQDFSTLPEPEHHSDQHLENGQVSHSQHPQPPATPTKAPLITSTAPTPPITTRNTAPRPSTEIASTSNPAEQEPPTPLTRRPTRGSTSSFKRTMSSIFRRSSSSFTSKDFAGVDSSNTSTESQLSVLNAPSGPPPTSAPRRFSMHRSSTTTRSNTPPSPGSPLEMALTNRSTISTTGNLPTAEDFKQKSRASTGFTLRGRAVNFVNSSRGGARPRHRRASSFDSGHRAVPPPSTKSHHHQNDETYPPERSVWPLPPDAGTGAKARRMSLSLPDDFTIDVAELQAEYEYQHKILGRHGKHLGKGAASKVTLMVRKGSPSELYAVKEFRGKSNRETKEEYEKKIKSEYSIAKSLHHPNIVETVRLCTDHGRWNHVMEYCSEGDLFSLVQKGFLKGEERKKDRLCLFKQLIQGINYLHANGIAHRDIKLENLLITKDSKLKITDFGVSEVFCGTHPGLRESGGQCGQNMGEVRMCEPGICGSEPYIAPEVLAKKEVYDPRALDVWSSAIIMIYMVFGGAIWHRAERGNLHYDKLEDGWKKWLMKHPEPGAQTTEEDYPCCYALDVAVNPPALRRLMLHMLNPDPKKRISINEVLNNRWFKNIECCQVESYDDPVLMIDATKKDGGSKAASKRIFCHNHLPPKASGGHSLGKMPGQAGY